MPAQAFSTVRLVNGSTGDPVLYLDYPGRDDAILFDGGENDTLTKDQLADVQCVFITHHHVDHFVGLDRIVRANLDRDKTLHLFGPVHTIARVYARVTSYEYPFFPFMKLEIEVHELDGATERVGRFGCKAKFAPPVLSERPWAGPVCYANDHFAVEAVPVVHTVPCLAFALVERGGHHPDPAKLARGVLRGGPWIPEALRLLHAGAAPDTALDIQGGRFTLATLAAQYFTASTGARVAYVTDTLFADELKPRLVELARGATRLYCDSFYAKAQAKDAAKHKHMLTAQAAELAKAAKVEELILIHFSTRYAGRYEPLVAEAAAVFPRTRAEI